MNITISPLKGAIILFNSGLAMAYYFNNIGNIGIYFTKYRNYIGIFIKNIYENKVLKLCVQYKHLHY